MVEDEGEGKGVKNYNVEQAVAVRGGKRGERVVKDTSSFSNEGDNESDNGNEDGGGGAQGRGGEGGPGAEHEDTIVK